MLADWIFARFIEILNDQEIIVRKKKRLFDPDDLKKIALAGFLTERNEIYLNSSKNQHKNIEELLQTLIHELSHVLLPETKEKYIKRLEKILWLKFSDKQKGILKSYIPKHEVKKNPA